MSCTATTTAPTRWPIALTSACLLLLLALAACTTGDSASSTSAKGESAQSWSPAKLTSVKGVPAAQIEAEMQQELNSRRPPRIDDKQWARTQRLYKIYGNNPLWLDSDGLHRTRTKALTDALLNAHSDGMRMEAYPIGELAQSIANIRSTKQPTAEQLAHTDVMLTASYAALGEDLLTGQVDPKSVGQSWYVDPQDENVDSALVRNLRFEALDKALAGMRPAEEDYLGLRRELLRYREIVAKGGWQPIPATKLVKPGEPLSAAVATALRNRLAVEGIVVAAGPATASMIPQATPAAARGTYDRGLASAVALYQSRHAIAVDSSLGKETLESMNVTASARLAQIAANMERFRWLPRSFGSRYILVNVPAFRLEAYDGNKKALEMKVIVGQEYEGRITPVFADSMEYVVFRPYWLVTPDIAREEIFPKGAAYIAKENMEVYTAQGQQRIRQKPGPKNSLGLIKFMFPNDFNIYLHDTPNDELFKKDVRAFSHGCIRLEKPDALAQFVLGWDQAKIQEAMQNGPDDKSVKLPSKIPVYIAYFTTYIANNQLHFGNDLYSRDDKLIPAIMTGAMPTKETVDAVQALRRIAAGA
ncbi:MAG TPA: L,D-transpeptidase family protein [Gemmatimonadaceae bacterium]|nr:L,D-transpeptidase family protein [Gemmatimonadaceae bacterium]